MGKVIQRSGNYGLRFSGHWDLGIRVLSLRNFHRQLSSRRLLVQQRYPTVRRRSISWQILKDIRRDLGISIIPEEKVQLQKTDAKTCEKCGHNEHTYYSRQMRSADEGATTFYVCTNCAPVY